MSNFNTRQWLKSARERAEMGGIIFEDRPCPKCDYNLRGLRFGGVCPECGRVITFSLRAPDRRKTLADAPVPYIRLLEAGYFAMGVGGLFVPAIVVLRNLGLAAPMAWTGLAAAAMWLIGLAVVALPRPAQARHDADDAFWWALRVAAIASQSAWLWLAMLAADAGGQLQPGRSLSGGLALAGTLGFVPTFWLIKRMAVWGEDPHNGDRAFNAGLYLAVLITAWGMGLRLRLSIPVPNLKLFLEGAPMMAPLLLMAYGYAMLQVLREAQSASWTAAKIKDDRARQSRDEQRRHQEKSLGDARREREGFGGPLAAPPGSMFTVGRPTRASGHGGQDLPQRRPW